MLGRYSAAFGGALLGALLLLDSAVGQEAAPQDAAPTPAAERAELERTGATIRKINVTVDNVFDPSNPAEDKKLYRWANRMHSLTHTNVIENVLVFRVGDAFESRLLEESERALRAGGLVAEASVTPARYDAATNTVEVDVRVRDSWSLTAEMKLSRKGGENKVGFGLSDGNLFGTGKNLSISYTSDVDRDETFLGYDDPNVFNSRVRLGTVLARASDGHRKELTAERPFYALDTRWALGAAVRDVRRIDTMYDLGEETDEFSHDIHSLTLQGGWSQRGLVDKRAQRWIVGVTSDEDRFFPTTDMPQTLLLPENRKFVYPWFGWQLVEDDYREMTELNDMGRTEDVSLGLNLLVTLGFAKTSFGSDRDALLFRTTAQTGWEPAPGQLLLFNAGGSTRSEDDGLRNTVTHAGMTYYRRNLQKHLFSATLQGVASHRLDPDTQVLLGGDNGLRGYPLRYQAGQRRMSFTAEQRFYTDRYPWRLFRVGYAAFLDAGRVEGRDPRATPSLGTLYDVGVGLRLSSPRSSGRSIVHIDLAFPLNGDPSIDHVQLNIETKGTF